MFSSLTPVDNAFELMGLDRSAALMQFIFVQSFLGKAVFALGFLLALYKGVQQASLRPFAVFCAVFFSCWMLFIVPSAAVSVYPSVMEDRGFKDITTHTVLEKRGFREIRMNPIFLSAVQSLNRLTNNMIAILGRENAAGDGFLKSPFLSSNLSVLTGSLLGNGIADAGLKARMVNFFIESYWPALRRLADAGDGGVPSVLWPGDERVLSQYSADEAREWRGLRDELYDQVNGESRLFDQAYKLFNSRELNKDLVVRDLLATELEQKPGEYSVAGYETREGQVWGQGASWQEKDGQAWVLWILAQWPYVYGGLLMLLYAVFPVVLMVVMVRADAKLLSGYFLGFVVLKLSPFLFALVNEGSLLLFARFSADGIWRATGVNVFVAVGIIGVLAGVAGGAVLCVRPRTGWHT